MALLLACVSVVMGVLGGCGGGAGGDDEFDYRYFRDAQGRVLILRGANVSNSSKNLASAGLPHIDESDVARMRESFGFNVTRYLVFWEQIEPEPGVYDDAYLAQVRERLDWFHEQDMYVVLDVHQDVYARRFCCDGAPEWAIRDDGIPFEESPEWFANYLHPAVQRAFDNFWDAGGPHADLQEHFTAMWVHLATTFRDHPAVLAYDIINEPHPGSDFDFLDFASDRNTSRSVSFDREKLQPFYQRVIDAIRTVDADTWILFEPRYGAPGDGGRTWFTELVDPRPGARRIGMAPHMYVFATEATLTYTDANARRVLDWERERLEEVERLEISMWLGEFGTFAGVENVDRYMTDLVDMTERMMIGYAYWSWDCGGFGLLAWPPDEDGFCADGPLMPQIVRPYPQAIAGTPVSFGFDGDTRTLTVAYERDGRVSGPTEIFTAQELVYDGARPEVTVAGAGTDWSVAWDDTRQLALVTVGPGADPVTITVQPPR